MAKKKNEAEKSVEEQRKEFFAREKQTYDERMKTAATVEADQADEESTAETDETEVKTKNNEESEGDK